MPSGRPGKARLWPLPCNRHPSHACWLGENIGRSKASAATTLSVWSQFSGPVSSTSRIAPPRSRSPGNHLPLPRFSVPWRLSLAEPSCPLGLYCLKWPNSGPPLAPGLYPYLRLDTGGRSQKLSPLHWGEGKGPFPILSPRERGRSQRPHGCVQRKMWDTLSAFAGVTLPKPQAVFVPPRR